MVNIVFRHYQEGDEKQLADLFNLVFKRRVVERTPTSWHWRYVESPGFEPEMCQIAEDIDKRKIVGVIFVNLIEIIPIGQKQYIVGEINDVSIYPSYTKRGIATRLLKNSIDYMNKKGCDFSILSTGVGSLANRLYQKLGYFDIEKEYSFVQIPNIVELIRSIFGFAFLFPVLFTISYLPRFLSRLRIKFKKFFKDFSYEINHNTNHLVFMNTTNRISPTNYDGYPNYDKAKFIWARVKVPSDQQKPIYIIVRKSGKIIGGSIFTYQYFKTIKTKLNIKIGIVHELFLDKEVFNNSYDLQLGYIYLIDKLIKAATRRKLGILIYISSFKNIVLNQAFKEMQFFKIQNVVIMIKELKKNLKFPKLKKPLYIPTYLSLGI
ncbi:MAG: GNAT family N-acetyltransferase [Candidatus Hermodarchaeota archaeon]